MISILFYIEQWLQLYAVVSLPKLVKEKIRSLGQDFHLIRQKDISKDLKCGIR